MNQNHAEAAKGINDDGYGKQTEEEERKKYGEKNPLWDGNCHLQM